jgi:hypothetical protein
MSSQFVWVAQQVRASNVKLFVVQQRFMRLFKGKGLLLVSEELSNRPWKKQNIEVTLNVLLVWFKT